MNKTTTLGPLSMEAALLKLLDQVKRAVAKGGTRAMGAKRIDRPGAFMQPTILVDIKPGNPAFRRNSSGRSRFSSESRTRTRRWRSPMTRNSGWGVGRHQGCCARQMRSEPRRHRHDVRQSSDLDDTGLAVPWHQELRLRTRALQHGHPGVREQKASSRRFDRRAGIGVLPVRSTVSFSLRNSVRTESSSLSGYLQPDPRW